MENKGDLSGRKKTGKPIKKEKYEIGGFEAIMMSVVCIASAFILIAIAALYSSGFQDSLVTLRSVVVILAGLVVLFFCFKLIWWRYKHQKAKKAKREEQEETAIIKAKQQPPVKKGKP